MTAQSSVKGILSRLAYCVACISHFQAITGRSLSKIHNFA
ncbi:hypothetical protein EDC14_100384 [Hydrogenispora ethanolica]|uniref:Uncharacterized protein n=1 Tax=Hydrogenispora ethanolica TaxID=1082276 RepID=A0A4R1S6Z4_HYDET|nr:hypothetical protein EDC14_100384 [Hydrogenispora ethanolica]